MKRQITEYTSGGVRFIGQLFWDEAAGHRRPGVLVFPEAFGLNDHALQRAERLAQLGYVALAADFHGAGVVYDDLQALTPAIRQLYADRTQWRARARAALSALQAQPQVDAGKVAAIGFCFGGSTCFELARAGAPLAAIVTFHAGLLAGLSEDAGRIRAKVLICHGADDPVAKKDALEAVVAELKRDQVDWQLISYGNAVHSFTNPAADHRNTLGFAYQAQADARSWQAMRGLLEEAFT